MKFTMSLVFWIALLALATPSLLFAESRVLTGTAENKISFEGMIIDSIIIDNQNILIPKQSGVTGFVFRAARSLHFVTIKSRIKDELLFEEGEAFSSELAEETARNLRSRLTINDAWIIPKEVSPGHLFVTVKTIDQWSLIATAKVDTDGNESKYRFGLEERNLLGQAQSLTFDLVMQENERDYVEWGYRNSRVRGKPLQIRTTYNDDPLAEERTLSISRPYYNLYQKFSSSATISATGGRHDEYRDQVLAAQWQNKGDIFTLRSDYRIGSYNEKLQAGINYRYVYQTVSDTLVNDTNALIVFPVDSIRHQFGLSLALIRLDYVVANRINGFIYNEDFTLQKSIGVGYERAFLPSFDEKVFDRVSVGATFGEVFGNHIVILSSSHARWFNAGIDIRRRTEMSARIYNTQYTLITGAFRAQYLSDHRLDGAPSLNLGGKSGLRGYDTRFSTGSKRLLFNLEGRIFPGLEILSVLVGGVLFADVGRTWNAGESFRFKDFDASVGAGLRFSFERLTRAEMLRIDFSVDKNNNLQVSIGTGQYF